MKGNLGNGFRSEEEHFPLSSQQHEWKGGGGKQLLKYLFGICANACLHNARFASSFGREQSQKRGLVNPQQKKEASGDLEH